MKKIIISILLIITLFTVSACNKESNKNTENTELPTTTESINNNESSEVPEDPNAEGFKVGNMAPDFEVKLLSGETAKLSDFKGKPVLLNFWATWCGPCKYEMPDFQKLQDEYGDNITILAINLGESENEVEKYIEENNFTYKIGIDEMAEIKYPVIALPTTFLLDNEGRIVLFEEGVPSEDVYNFYKEKINELQQ